MLRRSSKAWERRIRVARREQGPRILHGSKCRFSLRSVHELPDSAGKVSVKGMIALVFSPIYLTLTLLSSDQYVAKRPTGTPGAAKVIHRDEELLRICISPRPAKPTQGEGPLKLQLNYSQKISRKKSFQTRVPVLAEQAPLGDHQSGHFRSGPVCQDLSQTGAPRRVIDSFFVGY
jgi:hypothetical protein